MAAHHHEDASEFFFVTAGRLGVMMDGEWTSMGPSGYTEVPHEVVHTFRNEAEEDLRFITAYDPMGFEGFFEEFGLGASEPGAFEASLSDVSIRRVVEGCHRFGMILAPEGPSLSVAPDGHDAVTLHVEAGSRHAGVPTVHHDPLDLALATGSLRVHRSGPPEGRLVVCVPGLSSNGRAFDLLAERLADEGRHVVAIDLRGRGLSATTPAGTYGWLNHARDVVAAAGLLSGAPVDLIGHSMGAFVGMQAAALAPDRVRRLVLVDAVGPPEPQTGAAIRRAVERLGATYPSAEEYVDRVRQVGSVVPWSERWERAFRYELVDVEGGVRSRTDRAAVLEDLAYGEAHDPRALWGGLGMPVLLVRSALPILPGQGFVVRAADRDAFVARVSGGEVVEIAANHYGVMTHEGTASAIARFLS